MSQARKLFLLTSIVALGACAAPEGEYPTLAIRDVERVSGTFEAPPPAPLPTPAASTLAQLDDLAAQVRDAHTAFVSAVPDARRSASAASGAARGTAAWGEAQVAIAELESRRSAAMIALADMDRLFVAAATSGESTEGIEQVRAESDALVQEQNIVIDSLLEGLAR